MENNNQHIISSIVHSSKLNGGDDVIFIEKHSSGTTFLLLADGASGVGYGREAALVVLEIIHNILGDFDDLVLNMDDALIKADNEIKKRNINGDTTAILFAIKDNQYAISSIGDSEVWMLGKNGFQYLTYKQIKKPRVGSGARKPEVQIGFIEGPIILCSDGLRHAISEQNEWFNYCNDPHNWSNLLLQKALNKWDNELPDDLSIITIYPTL
jgi:serine/threonine protein phosphatase PrpC